ncbi:MBL fold metallo-hydrolase [Micromonospora sp. NBS 11-29]|uniref:MBL fold metallo-hydrolase n=1 Tax=Micromonospora sp. NBS 11-29 TaxID=1960879 RepID=UPI000B78586A|nr:MBL fold metallo-hydrolase [Micromonospora sp. NBS 11-29]
MELVRHLSSRRALLAALSAVPAAGLLRPATARAATPGLPGYLPIPSGSVGPALNADGYHVGRIRGDLHWVTDGFYQAMFLSTREGVVLVDAPPTIGGNLQRAIDSATLPAGRPNRVTHLVYSHSHADHIGAAALFGRGVERVAHVETRRLLREAGDDNRPLPTVTFDDRYELRVGGERLDLSYHGPNHSPDNIVIHAPRQSTLMVVDVLYPGWVPFRNLAVSQDVAGWKRMHAVIMGLPWTTFVGGHLGRLGTRADGDVQRSYVADLERSARATIASLDPTPFFDRYGPEGNSWAIFKAYLDAAAAQAAEPVVREYAGRLGAVDVFTVDNAFSMLEYLRIDAGLLGPFGIRP